MQAARTYGIFSISDIVTLICGYLEFQDLVNLLTVSRTFFHCSSPHVWTKLSGPQPLMGLLSQVVPDGVSKRFENPEQLDQQSLLRFDLYAPLVRKIDVDPTEEATKLAWHFLLRRVPRRPLLPGLRRLALGVGSSSHHEPFEAVLCALALLCPSLVQVTGPRDGDAWVEPSPASLLLQGLAQTAPDLEILQLRVLSQKQIPYTKSSLFSSLAALRSLRILHCSTAMIDSPVMLLLGTLPELESLQINAPAADEFDSELDNGDLEDDLSLDHLMLPPHSFSSLRHLNLEFLPCRVISQLWSSAPLVQQLISVHVRFHPDDATQSDSTIVNRTICDICRGSTDIIELRLGAQDYLYIELSPVTMSCLQQLPLRRLKLFDISLPVLSGSISLFVSTTPNVEYLDVQAVAATFDDLVLIARHLPKLRFLVTYLTLTGWPNDLEGRSITPSPSTLRLGSEFVFNSQTDVDQNGSTERYIDIVARHLHTLWPNGINCEQEATYYLIEDTDDEYFSMLKSKLKALNPLGYELPGCESYGATWSY